MGVKRKPPHRKMRILVVSHLLLTQVVEDLVEVLLAVGSATAMDSVVTTVGGLMINW